MDNQEVVTFMAKVEIKGIIDGLDVGPFNGYDITEITIPQALMTKGISAVFPNSYGKITTIRCANDVTSISSKSLDGCENLQTFQFSNAISTVEPLAFDNLTNVRTVIYGKSVPSSANLNVIAPNATAVEWTEGVVATGYYCCSDAVFLTTVSFPDSLIRINSECFKGCTALESIDLLNIEQIDISGFNGCTALREISFSAAIKTIQGNAFSGCSGLVAVSIQDETNWCRVSFANAESNPMKYASTITHNNGQLFVSLENPYAEKISNYSFGHCATLESVSLQDITKEIGDYAFDSCLSLSQATASGVEKIGRYAFRGCTALQSADSIISHATSLGQYAFVGCAAITSLRIPGSISSITSNAFRSCTGLTSVVIEDGVTSIGDYAFANCSSLTTITIPPSVASISTTAFVGTGLSSVTTDDGMVTLQGGMVSSISSEATSINFNMLTVHDSLVTVVGFMNGVFSGKTGLTSLVLPESMRTIPDSCFSGLTNLTAVTLPQNLDAIGRYAFQKCSSLTAISMPDSVRSIGESAFSNTTSLVTLKIDSTSRLETIGATAFYGSRVRTTSTATGQTNNFLLPNGMKSIGTNAFQGCASLLRFGIRDRNDSIPADCVIGDGVFKGCTSLTTVAFGNGVSYVGENLFEGSASIEYDTATLPPLKLVDGWVVGWSGSADDGLVVGAEARGIAQRALSEWTTLAGELTIRSDVFLCDYAFNGCTKLEKATIEPRSAIPKGLFYGCSKLASVALPEGLQTIGGNAFNGDSSLKSISLPDSLLAIGSYAFSGSGLTSIVVPDGVTVLGAFCFYNCWAMTTARIGRGITDLPIYLFGTAHPNDADGNFSHLTTVKFDGEIHDIGNGAFRYNYNLKNFSIPKTTTRIGESAFFECESIQRLDIPGSCKAIGDQAFCAVGLAYPELLVNIAEGVESFKPVNWASDAFRYCLTLKKIRIPSTVRNLGTKTFRQCPALEKMEFVGDAPSADSIFGDSTTEANAVKNGQVTISVQPGATGFGTIPGTWQKQNTKYMDS